MASADAQTPLEPGRVAGASPWVCSTGWRSPPSARAGSITDLALPARRPRQPRLPVRRCVRLRHAAVPTPVAAYQIAAGRLTVRWDGDRVLQWTFAATADGITLDGDLHRPARPIPRARLLGPVGRRRRRRHEPLRVRRQRPVPSNRPGRWPRRTYRVEGLAAILTFADGDYRRRTLFATSASDPVRDDQRRRPRSTRESSGPRPA